LTDIFLENLSFSYYEKEVVVNIDMDITTSSTGIVGPNGSGKTTILKLIGGLLKNKHGNIRIDNKLINYFTSTELAKIFAYVSQDKEYTLGFSVEEVIEMGRYPYLGTFSLITKNDQMIIDKTVEILGLESLRKCNTEELSSGEKQKVRIARALVQEPNYILLDEPTSNLDLSNKILLLNVLDDITDLGVRLLITSHDLEFIKQATDQSYMINRGEILVSGPSEEVIVRDNIKKLYGLSVLPEWVA
jgi:iron complex transport system ATP-binding protein